MGSGLLPVQHAPARPSAVLRSRCPVRPTRKDDPMTNETDHVLSPDERMLLVAAALEFDIDGPTTAADLRPEYNPFEAAAAKIVADRLNNIAFDITRELICCDVYERLSTKPTEQWTKDERREYRAHSICYWGSASRALVLDALTPDTDDERTSRNLTRVASVEQEHDDTIAHAQVHGGAATGKRLTDMPADPSADPTAGRPRRHRRTNKDTTNEDTTNA